VGPAIDRCTAGAQQQRRRSSKGEQCRVSSRRRRLNSEHSLVVLWVLMIGISGVSMIDQ